MNIKLHASPHTCPKRSCDLKDDDNHLALVRGCPIVFVLIISSTNIISTIIILMTTTLRWFEDVRVCLRLSFPIRGLPETAGACSELESCSCYDLFAVFVTVFVSVFVTVFVLSLSLISRSVGCQRAQVLAVNWKVVLVIIFLQSLFLSLLLSLFCHCL